MTAGSIEVWAEAGYEAQAEAPIAFEKDEKFTPAERACISRKIEKLVEEEGMERDQATAIAIKSCAPDKARRDDAEAPEGAERAAAASPEDEMLERRAEAERNHEASRFGYRAEQAADGSWAVFDVPIFSAHVDTRYGDEIHFDRAWLVSALEQNRFRVEKEGYLPPLHVRHHGFLGLSPVDFAGHFRLTKVASFRYNGTLYETLFADFVKVPDEAYRAMKSGKLPYRSVEIHDVAKPEIDSLALLDHDVPYFRYPLFSIKEEQVAATRFAAGAERATMRAALGGGRTLDQGLPLGEGPMRLYRAFDARGAAILARFEDEKKGGPPEKEGATSPEGEAKDEGGAGGLEAAKAAAAEALAKFTKAIQAVTAAVEQVAKDLGVAQEAAPPGQEEQQMQTQKPQQAVPQAAPASKPAEQPAPPQAPPQRKADVAACACGAALAAPAQGEAWASVMGEMTAMRQKLEALESRGREGEIVAAAMADLEKAGFTAKAIRADLERVARQSGEAGVKVFVDAAKRHGVPEPPTSVEQATRAEAPEMEKWKEKGPEALAAAKRYAALFDVMPRSMRDSVTRDDYIRVQIEADEAQAEAKARGRGKD